jgi:hypothetical protein
MAAYGDLEIENIVKDFKHDVIFSVNDTWGSQFVVDKNFFHAIPTVCWNTFDSLPLLPDTVEKAKKIKHYWTWSDFARKELHKLGHSQVKNQYPLVNTENFYKLPENKIKEILAKHNLPQNAFIIGFVFRNQLRKLINTQIEAYAQFKRLNPEIKNTFLYTHTHYGDFGRLEVCPCAWKARRRSWRSGARCTFRLRGSVGFVRTCRLRESPPSPIRGTRPPGR